MDNWPLTPITEENGITANVQEEVTPQRTYNIIIINANSITHPLSIVFDIVSSTR